MPINRREELAFSHPEQPCVIELYMNAYDRAIGALELAQRNGNAQRTRLVQDAISAVREKYCDQALRAQLTADAKAAAEAEFAIDANKAKLDAALMNADRAYVFAEIAERNVAIAEWDKRFGAAHRYAGAALDQAGDAVLKAFIDALEAATITAQNGATTAIDAYKVALSEADALMPPQDSAAKI